jgi:SAM-dependent methyltransferase
MGMMAYGILLAAEAEGLGAIYLGGVQNPMGIAEVLGAPEHLRNLGVICVGYPDDDPPAPPRRTVDEVTHWNTLKGLKRKCHPDIRPHVWTFEQLSDFREKVLWYKGVGFDARTFHTSPDPRFSKLMQYLSARAGQLISRYPDARVLDVMPHNGDTMLQVLQMMPKGIEKLYAYELSRGTIQFIQERLQRLLGHDTVEFLVNPGSERLSIPLGDDTVDAVLCYERLGQFDDPVPLLREIRRVLRPAGCAVVTVSNRWYPHLRRYRRSWRKNYALGLNWNYGPERLFSPPVIESMIQNAGLRVASSVGIIPAESTVIRRVATLAEKVKIFRLRDRLADLFPQYHPVTDWRRRFCSTLVYEVVKRDHE